MPETIRALVFTALIGDAAASLYDLRREIDEEIVEWSPIEAPVTRERRNPATSPTRRRRSKRSPKTGSRSRARTACRRRSASIRRSINSRRRSIDKQHAEPAVFVGPRGAGKTALVRRIARGLLERGRGKAGVRRRLWATSADRIVAGMVYLGMWQQRCLQMVKELEGGADVLYVDRLSDVMAPMSDGASIADLLSPAIIGGQLTLFAECDETELVRARQRNPALVEALRVIRVPEAVPAQVVALLEPYGQRLDPPVVLATDAARRLVELLAAFRRDTAFPGKAVAFVDYCSLHKKTDLSLAELTPAFARVVRACRSICSRPSARSTPRRSRCSSQKGVIGQDHACAIAGRVIARLKAGLDDPQRPVGALLFAGPTGVGKTELAKQLARYLFGDAERLVRVDMSEITTPRRDRAPDHAVARRHVARRSDPPPAAQSVVLFDEIEKADDAAFDLLLGVLGEGRLDRCVRPARRLPDVADRDDDEPRRDRSAPRRVLVRSGRARPIRANAIKNFFRPELLGRLDAVIPFRPLPPPALEAIVELELAKLRAATRHRRAQPRASSSPRARARGSPSSVTTRSSARARCAARSKI